MVVLVAWLLWRERNGSVQWCVHACPSASEARCRGRAAMGDRGLCPVVGFFSSLVWLVLASLAVSVFLDSLWVSLCVVG
jgi:hypothetical protein